MLTVYLSLFFFFQAEDGIRDLYVTGVQTCALPICEDEFGGGGRPLRRSFEIAPAAGRGVHESAARAAAGRSEEHTSELQSRRDLVCRLLLEKKKKKRRK